MMESPNTITANVQVNQISIQAKSKGLSTPPANIVVVGGGLAGFCAVIEAQKKGAIVTLLEKQNLVGGNSAKASSGINGLNTFAQELKGIVDTFTTFKADTVRSGGGLSEQTLVDMLVSSSTEAINWLHSVFNFNLVDLVQLGGHSFPRTHRFPSKDGKPIPVGWTLVSILKAHIETLSSVSIMRNANMTRLLTKNDDGDISVTGIEYEMEGSLIEMPCDAVILTTGGFAFDRGEGSLLREFAPSKLYLPTTSGPQADGAAIRIARRDAQAELVHMEYVQIHPTGFVDPNDPSCPSKILAPEALRGCGGVLLSYEGKRFCDELGTRDYVTARVQASSPSATPDKPALSYLVMNEDATTAFGKAALSFYMNRNLVQQCVGADEVAKYIKCDKENVLKTLSEIDLVSKGKIYDPHGRIVFPTYNWNPSQTFTVATVTPCIHYTMGGISINASAEVHARPFKIGSGPRIGGFASTPIVLGLYAAGECTGGVHGANRLAGNSLLECVVFGRTAGMRAADITLSSLPALNTEQYQPLRLQCRRTLSARGHIHEFTFDLPSTRHRLAPYFKTGQYISLRHWPEKASSTPVERFYSPISRDGTRGKLVLLIKAEPNRNEVQESLCNMKPGDMVEVKGPYGGLNFDLFDSSVERIGLIAGGSGVSPMVQIIRECLFTGAQKYIRLLWGVEYAEDLVYRKIMDEQARLHPDILNVTYIVNKPDFGWVGETGMIDASLIQRHMFRPGPGTKIVICGPYKMCLKMKMLLQELGYCDEMVYSFM